MKQLAFFSFLLLNAFILFAGLPEHPGYKVTPLLPEDDVYFVGGMDFLSDGRLVVCTWDGSHGKVTNVQHGDVFIFEGVLGDDPSQVTVTKIASELEDPLGLKVVDDRIFVLQTSELVELVKSEDGETYQERVINKLDYEHDRHEFQFGLSYKKPYFYGTASTAQRVDQVNPNRGTAWKIHEDTGERILLAAGMRESNGVTLGLDGAMYVTDNEGGGIKHCKMIRIEEGAHYGYSWANLDARFENVPETPPAIEFRHKDIGASSSEPIPIFEGPFAGQFFVGDVTWEGISRVEIENVNGTFQGCAFPFLSVDKSATNRMVWGPDGHLYVGSIGEPGNWPRRSRGFLPLVRIEKTNEKAFEMKSVKMQQNGFRVSFTKSIDPSAVTMDHFELKKEEKKGNEDVEYQVGFDESTGEVLVTSDKIEEEQLYSIRLSSNVKTTSGEEILHRAAYYRVNKIGAGVPVNIDPTIKRQHLAGHMVSLSRMGAHLLVETDYLEPYSIEFLHVNGTKIRTFEGRGKNLHTLRLPANNGMIIMQIKSGNKIRVQKIPVY